MKDKVAAPTDFIVGQVVAFERLSIQCGRIDIDILWTVIQRLDHKLMTILGGQCHTTKKRTSYHILIGAWSDCIETHGAEHIPCRHATLVLIAWETLWTTVVETVHDLANPILSLPGRAGIAIEIGQVLDGLIAMGILSHIGQLHFFHFVDDTAIPSGLHGVLHRENTIYLFHKGAIAAKKVDKTLHIVEARPDVMPGIALGIRATPLQRIERLDNGTSDIDTLDAFEYTFERDIARFIKYE